MAKVTQVASGASGATARAAWNAALASVAFSEIEAGAFGTVTAGSTTAICKASEIKSYVDSAVVGSTVVLIDQTDSPYTVLGTETVISVDASGGDVTVQFPTAVGFTAFPYIHQTDTSANNILVTPDGTEQIDGKGAGVAITLGTKEAIRVYSDNTNLQYV